MLSLLLGTFQLCKGGLAILNAARERVAGHIIESFRSASICGQMCEIPYVLNSQGGPRNTLYPVMLL